jgi:Zn finger protein HypA/HybF involved in hydrogenase expression
MRHVCLECGHTEYRELAPIECPVCGSEYVQDDLMVEDDLSEADIEALMMREMKVAANE